MVNIINDRDGVARRFPALAKTDDGKSLEHFAVVSLKEAEISGMKLPAGAPRIVYTAAPGSIRTIPFYEILSGKKYEGLTGTIMLVGATAPSLHDTSPTPLSKGKEMAGVEIHGNIANMLIFGKTLDPLPLPAMIGWVLLISVLIAALFIFIERLYLIAVSAVLLGAISLITAVIIFDKGLAANLVHLQFAVFGNLGVLSLYKFFVAESEKRVVRNTFSKYVSPHVLNQLLEHPEKVVLGGEEKEVTVLFSDIRDFTSISEKTTPTELVRVLNKYFSAVTKKITENGGVLDKYIGDAIMAFWGAPLPDEKQADRAVKAAKEMIEELKNLNKEFLAAGDPEIKIGVGIYTGPAVVGNVGSEQRFDYTVIGDTVNAASRLEGLTKEYKVPIIIGETTKNKLVENFSLKPLGETKVKGKSQPISIYAVL